MNIRKLVSKDIPTIADIIMRYKLKQKPNLDHGIKNDIIDQLESIVRGSTSHALVSTDERGTVTGFIHFHEIAFPMIARKELYISDLIVDEHQRGKNIGKSLLAEAEGFAQMTGVRRLMLNNAHDAESYLRGFYTKAGFSERTHISNFVKEMCRQPEQPEKKRIRG